MRISHSRDLRERLGSVLGRYPVRCRRCGTRFITSIWRSAGLRYARCPRCYRSDLSTWSREYYDCDTVTLLKLRLGATPYRCEYCRLNFASFRACKERYSWRKRKSGGSGPLVSTGPEASAAAEPPSRRNS